MLVIAFMNHNNVKLSSAIIGTLMILETAFEAVLAVIIVAWGGSSIVWFSLAWAVIGVIWAVRWRIRRPLATLTVTEQAE